MVTKRFYLSSLALAAAALLPLSASAMPYFQRGTHGACSGFRHCAARPDTTSQWTNVLRIGSGKLSGRSWHWVRHTYR